MSVSLARRFKVDVSTDGTTWLPFKGMQDFSFKENATTQSTAAYDNNGFDSFEKTLTAWDVTIKANRPLSGTQFDPGQELVRGAQFQFGNAARVYIRWYDKTGANDAKSGLALIDWNQSKTGVADVEEVTVNFKGDGVLSFISNPYQAAAVPAIASATPSGVAAGGLVRVSGANFTGTVAGSGVKINGIAASAFDVVSDSLLEAVMPTALAAPVITLGTTATTGGTFAAGTYYWVLTATNAAGETIASNELSAALTGTTSSQPINWSVVTGATGYKLYRGTAAGAENVLVTTIGSGATVTFTDTGAAGTAGTVTSKSGIVVTNAVGASNALAYTRG